MNTVTVCFCGAVFGSITMMLTGSLRACVRSMHKVALRAALTALTAPLMRPSTAVSMARAMPRTAWSCGSRIAWFDRDRREIAERTVSRPWP